jgi:CelD/BcsL family acetyltransferase involved in cellulose biosynthesis
MKVFENRVLRRIFGPRREEIRGSWRKLHNEDLHNLYSSPDIIRIIKARRIRSEGHVARMGAKRNAYKVLVRMPQWKRPLRIARCR